MPIQHSLTGNHPYCKQGMGKWKRIRPDADLDIDADVDLDTYTNGN